MLRLGCPNGILFTDSEINCNFRRVNIEPIKDINDYNTFILFNLHRYIDTKYVLIVQWDGYVISSSWSNKFYDYDYIGAIWYHLSDQNRVGNGGFSFRSLRLLRLIALHVHTYFNEHNEDYLICRTFRGFLEAQYAIKFAPETVAEKFSYEYAVQPVNTLGFHGIWNAINHESDTELDVIVDGCPPEYFKRMQFLVLMINCYNAKRYRLFSKLFKLLELHLGENNIKEILVTQMGLEPFMVDIMISDSKSYILNSILYSTVIRSM